MVTNVFLLAVLYTVSMNDALYRYKRNSPSLLTLNFWCRCSINVGSFLNPSLDVNKKIAVLSLSTVIDQKYVHDVRLFPKISWDYN